MERRKSRTVTIGSVAIGGRNPVAVQSMTNTKTENIPATVVGRTTGGKDRIIRNGEEKRFLEPAKPDELYQI